MKTYRLQISLMCDGYATKDFHEVEFSSMGGSKWKFCCT